MRRMPINIIAARQAVSTIYIKVVFLGCRVCIGWGLGLGQLPDFYHFSALTGSCQLLPF